MRGNDEQSQSGMFSYVPLEERIPADHPLRAVRRLVDTVLAQMSKDFDRLYAKNGRPSIAPERLLRALLLQVFYSVRSERLLMEQLDYNLLFRWFVGLDMDDRVWNHAVFSKNRERLLNQELAQRFFAQVKSQAAGLMSDEHFTVDGTLIEAWASHKSSSVRTGMRTEVPALAAIFMARSGATIRMSPRRTRTPDSIRNRRDRRPNSATWAMWWSRTATA